MSGGKNFAVTVDGELLYTCFRVTQNTTRDNCDKLGGWVQGGPGAPACFLFFFNRRDLRRDVLRMLNSRRSRTTDVPFSKCFRGRSGVSFASFPITLRRDERVVRLKRDRIGTGPEGFTLIKYAAESYGYTLRRNREGRVYSCRKIFASKIHFRYVRVIVITLFNVFPV